MFRFVHTADWQIGMMACGLGTAAEKVRTARLESISRILEVAQDRKANAILVAGDLFEDNQVAQALVEQVVGLLNDRAHLPIYIIPGNHDPYTRDSVYRRSIWTQLRSGVRVLATPEPVRLADNVVLFPCPLQRKNGPEDPTVTIPAADESNGIRLGLAHGTMRFRQDIGDDDFPIALDACKHRRLDYLALGHWHSTLPDPANGNGARAFYSGTHEQTGFGERDSGNVLVVTVDGPGAMAQVEAVRTGGLTWLDLVVNLDVEPLSDVACRLRDMPNSQRTLLRLDISGQERPEDAGTWADVLVLLGERFLYTSWTLRGCGRPTSTTPSCSKWGCRT